MPFKTFLLFLVTVSAHVASAAIYNGSSIVRTFGRTEQLVTDEPLDLEKFDLYEDDLRPAVHPSNRLGGGQGISRGINQKVNLDVNKEVNPGVNLGNGTARIGTNHSRELRHRIAISDEAKHFLTSPLSTIFIPSLYTLVCLVSVPLNAIALVVFARRIRPLKPAVIFMMNLASADLLFALSLPFKISYHFSGNNWMFGSAMCRMVSAAFYCNMYGSVLLIACISVDRLLAVVYPIDSLTWRRPRNAVIACVVMWILAVAGSVPLVLSEQTGHLPEMGITTCFDIQDMADLEWFYMIYFSTISCALFFLPLLVTVVCYSRVIWSLSRVPRGFAGRSRRKARAVVMALTVLVLFMVCFTPSNCLLLAHSLLFSQGGEAPDSSYTAYLVCLCVGSLSCCLDPLVYYFGSSQCQRQLVSVFGCQKGVAVEKSMFSSSDSSRNSSRTILKSSMKSSSMAKTPIAKMDSHQASLQSQYKKLLV